MFTREQPEATLVTTGLYKMVRHPAMSFLIGAFFISPVMVPTIQLCNNIFVIILHRVLVN